MKLGCINQSAAAAYIAHYPCLQKANTVAFNYGGAAGYASLVGGDPFWYFLGCPVKFRTPSGSTGITSDVIYYIRKQGIGSYTLHNTQEGAYANNDSAPLTSNGGGTNYLFPAFVVDVAWTNHGVFNTKFSDQNAFATTNYIGSNSESGSQAQNFTVPMSAMSGKYAPSTGSLFISAKVKGPVPSVNKRGIFGNGGIGASQPGFSVYSDAVDPSKVRIGISDSVTTIASLASSTTVFDSSEHTVALAVNGPAGIATLYVDGVADVSLSMTTRPSLLSDFCIGGYGTNALLASLRSVHILGFSGYLPTNIAALAAHLSANSQYNLLDSQIS